MVVAMFELTLAEIKSNCKTHGRATFTYDDVRDLCFGFGDLLYLESQGDIERTGDGWQIVETKQ